MHLFRSIIIAHQNEEAFGMYALIIVIAVLSPAGGAVTPVGVTSQVIGILKI